jgi:hypothetical protein
MHSAGLATGAAFLVREPLGRPASEYGLYFMAFPAGYILGNFVSSRLGGRVAIEPMVLIGGSVAFVAVAVAAQASLILSGTLTTLVIFGPGFVITFAQGISLPNGQAGMSREAGNLAGTGAGIAMLWRDSASIVRKPMFTGPGEDRFYSRLDALVRPFEEQSLDIEDAEVIMGPSFSSYENTVKEDYRRASLKAAKKRLFGRRNPSLFSKTVNRNS